MTIALIAELNNDCQNNYNKCIQNLNQMRAKGEISDIKVRNENKKCKDILEKCLNKAKDKECELKNKNV